MAHATEAELVQLLTDCQRRGGQDPVDPEKLAHVDIDAAYRISRGQMEALGETSTFYKTAILPDGTGVAAPIFSSRVGKSSPDFVFPSGLSIKGVEFEVGVELARDIAPGENLDEEAFSKAVSDYFVGIEVVGTRLAPTKTGEKPSTPVQLSDHFSALGYVVGASCSKDIDVLGGLTVTMEVDGKQFHSQTALQPFRTVLASAVAYAKTQNPAFPLKAGTKITTGALSGCVFLPEGAKGLVVGRVGSEEPVQFMLP